MKIVTKILPDTVQNLSPPQARKNYFIWMGHLYRAFGPGTTCWPGGGMKCSPGVGGSKIASRGEEWLLTPPTPTYGPKNRKMERSIRCKTTSYEFLKANIYYQFSSMRHIFCKQEGYFIELGFKRLLLFLSHEGSFVL